jgi:hypothetical protein
MVFCCSSSTVELVQKRQKIEKEKEFIREEEQLVK